MDDLGLALLAIRQKQAEARTNDIERWQRYEAASSTPQEIIDWEREEQEKDLIRRITLHRITICVFVATLSLCLFSVWKLRQPIWADREESFYVPALLASIFISIITGVMSALVPKLRKTYCWELAELKLESAQQTTK